MYIKRDLEAIIIKYLPKPEILAVIGPRQSGKTTLLKHVVKSLRKATFLDFEDRDLLNLFNTDIKAFFNLHVSPLSTSAGSEAIWPYWRRRLSLKD